MAILDILSFLSPKSIGGITIGCVFEEKHNDTLTVTEHPVEKGAAITDHAYKNPPEVTIKAGWSNSDFAAIINLLQSIFTGGGITNADYVNSVYSQLLALQETRFPFSIVTNKRLYTNMLLTSLEVTTDMTTNNALAVTATCRQIFIVSTTATDLPPRDNQQIPESTASVENAGTKSAIPATPSNGGAVPAVNF